MPQWRWRRAGCHGGVGVSFRKGGAEEPTRGTAGSEWGAEAGNRPFDNLGQVDRAIPGVQARLDAAVDPTDGAFEDGATRVIRQPRWEGKVMTGADYFLEHAVPNFFFHLTHTYAILRHNGVDVGKRDYLGPITLREP